MQTYCMLKSVIMIDLNKCLAHTWQPEILRWTALAVEQDWFVQSALFWHDMDSVDQVGCEAAWRMSDIWCTVFC